MVSLFRYNMLSVLKGSTNLHYSAILSTIAMLLLGINFLKSEKAEQLLRFLTWGFAVGCLAVLAFLAMFPTFMEVGLHYKARTINALFPIIIVIAMAAMRFKYILLDEKRWRRAVAIVTTLGIFQCCWHTLATQQWAGYLDVFREEVSSRKGFIAFEDSVLAYRNIQRQIIAGMNWTWSLPLMSIVLAPQGRVQAIIGNQDPRWSSHPFDPREAKELPDLSRYGVSYTEYLAQISNMVTAQAFTGIRFENVTQSAGIEYTGETFGAAWGDFNGDGWPDIWVSNHTKRPSLYLNQKNGTFRNVIDQVWSANPRADTHTAAWADFDNDGDEDLVETVGAIFTAR